MVVSKGYKETELGRIPMDWQITTLEQIADVRTGPFGSVLHASDYVFLGTPIITVEHLGERGITRNNLPRVSDSDRKRLSKYTLNVGDIVFSRVGSIDRNAYVTKDEDGWLFSGRLLRIRPFPNGIYDKYLSYYFKQRTTISRIESISVGQTMASLNTQLMNQFQVIVPTLTEQHAIATALSDVDKLIDSLESLIEKKKAIKQGAMQELLTGRKRLPGFNGKWKERYLHEIGVFMKGRGLSKSNLSNEGFPCILYGEIFTTYNNEIKKVVSKSTIKEGILSQKEDVLLPCSTTTKGIDLAKAVFLRLDGVLIGGDIIAIRNLFRSYNPYFLAAILTNTYQNRIAEISQGITIIHLNASKLKNIKVMLPPTIDEQQAIAEILSDMDNEIEALTQKLKKTRQIKQGMMQELLTGHIRLLQTATQKQKEAKMRKLH